MKKLFLALVISLFIFNGGNNAFSQNVNVGPVAPATYLTLGAAFTAINGGVHGAGAINVNIVGNTTELATATLNGGVFASCLIRPTAAVTVTGNFGNSVITLNGADNVTIDGRIGGVGTTISLIINNPFSTATTPGCIVMQNGANNNIISYCQCSGFGFQGTLGGRLINVGQSVAGTGGNNGNIIENNLVIGGRRGIQNFGSTGLFSNDNTIIRNNVIKNSSSLHIFVGNETINTNIINNEMFNDAPVDGDIQPRCIGIQGNGTINITGNKIHDMIYSTLAPPGTSANIVSGMVIFPQTLTVPVVAPSTVNVINNFVSNNVGDPARFVFGIRPSEIAGTTAIYTSNIYNNTVRLSGNMGAAIAGYSSSILVDNLVPGSEVNVLNNISINNKTGGDVNTLHAGMDLTAYPDPTITFLSDYNFSFATDTSGRGFDAGYAGRYFRFDGGLSLMKDTACADNNEQHSVFKNINLVSNANLHLAGPVGGDIKAQPLAAVPNDIDGTVRNVNNPYIGADEGATLKVLNFGGLLETNSDVAQVTVTLKNGCSIVSSCTADLDGLSGNAKICFGDSVGSGPYYIDVQSLNHLETYSSNPVSFAGAVVPYDFTTNVAKAFGNNLTSAAPHAFFAGDRNQDGFVDLTDLGNVFNDASAFLVGCRLLSDMNADEQVDLTDLVSTFNSAALFVQVASPCPEPSSIGSKHKLDFISKMNKYNVVSIPKVNNFQRQ